MESPLLFVPIGPSGSGKSTLFGMLKLQHPEMYYFSLDALRHLWYDATDYNNAWHLANQDRTFKNKSGTFMNNLMDGQQHLYLDNTNLTPKSRRPALMSARHKGYKLCAVVFQLNIETVLARQFTRTDKCVPAEAVIRQHESLVVPQENEGFSTVVYIRDVSDFEGIPSTVWG